MGTYEVRCIANLKIGVYFLVEEFLEYKTCQSVVQVVRDQDAETVWELPTLQGIVALRLIGEKLFWD